MRLHGLLLVLILRSFCVQSQQQASDGTWKSLHHITDQNVDSIWSALVNQNMIPVVMNDSVAFLYRGSANSVKWMGDFNGWGGDTTFHAEGSQIASTDLWILKASFPSDARLDYKIVVDERWILDPVNPYQQWSGVDGGSPNSELRMPGWKSYLVGEHNALNPRGKVYPKRIESNALGYEIAYSLYVPATKLHIDRLPVLYVTDGYEYMHEKLGNMCALLDHLILIKKIRPLVVVFVDHRDPSNPIKNRRMEELSMNPSYLQFFLTELIPVVEGKNYAQRPASQRGIMGTSLGALSAAYFAASKPEVFGFAGMQSPAFWFRPQVYDMVSVQKDFPRTFLSTGTINDTKTGAEKMKTILQENACTFRYKEVSQGHSWGNWKGHLHEVIIYFLQGK